MGATRYRLFLAQQFLRCTVTPNCPRLIQHGAHCFDCARMAEASYHRLHRSQVENAIHGRERRLIAQDGARLETEIGLNYEC